MRPDKRSLWWLAACACAFATIGAAYLQSPARTQEPVASASSPIFENNATAADACAAVVAKANERFSDKARIEPCPGATTTVWHDPQNQKFIIDGYIDFSVLGGTVRRTRYRAEAHYKLSDKGKPTWTAVEVTPTGQ